MIIQALNNNQSKSKIMHLKQLLGTILKSKIKKGKTSSVGFGDMKNSNIINSNITNIGNNQINNLQQQERIYQSNIDYKKLIIVGYEGRGTMPYVPYFKQQAQIAKRNNFVEFADFFNACKIVVSDWQRNITSWCDDQVNELGHRINYWQNLFIYDDTEWAERVKQNGDIVDDYSLSKHHEEQQVDRVQKVKELEQEKEKWKYEKHCVEIYLDDYTIKRGEEKRNVFDNTPRRQYITLKYNTLVEIKNQILQAEKDL
jgi:hypothetical protein